MTYFESLDFSALAGAMRGHFALQAHSDGGARSEHLAAYAFSFCEWRLEGQVRTRRLLARASFYVDSGATSFLMELKVCLKALSMAVKTLRQFQEELDRV